MPGIDAALSARSRPTVEPSGSVSPGAPLPLRVAFLGARARELLGPGVEPVSPDSGATSAQTLDALVLGSDAQLPREELEWAAGAARAAGAAVIGFGESAAASGLVDVVAGAARDDRVVPVAATPPPVDIRAFNPLRFSARGVAGFLAAVRPGAPPSGVATALPTLAEAARQEPVSLRAPPEVRAELEYPSGVAPGTALDADPPDLLEILHKRLGVIDHPSLHPSEWERAGWIAKLCAAGVPVVCAEISPGLRELLGQELASLLEEVGPRDLADLDRRERLSVALRRLALQEHSIDACWRRICGSAGIAVPARPLVSVIMPTRREEWLEHGLSQIARQTYEPRELILSLHGDAFSPDIEERLRAQIAGPVKFVRVDGDLTLGDALNAGVEVAEGALVTKMDDDDYYNVDHLWDLALACEYSGADLVGKAAEFVYLEQIDVTVRQISHDVDTRLAGGGLMALRESLVAVGGWPQRTRGEDLALIRRVAGEGRKIHRIPPLGYILNRHGRDHTWGPRVDYFLFRSQHQWRGLRFDVTAIEPAPKPDVPEGA